MEIQHNDGPWERPDSFRKLNAIVRYSRGDTLNGFAATLMGYRGRWHATDQVPARAIRDGRLGRFGTIDESDGGESYRYSGSVEWQHTRDDASINVTAFGIAYDLNLFSNFTYSLDDPENGDVPAGGPPFRCGRSGLLLTIDALGRRAVLNTIGAQIRNDAIENVGL